MCFTGPSTGRDFLPHSRPVLCRLFRVPEHHDTSRCFGSSAGLRVGSLPLEHRFSFCLVFSRLADSPWHWREQPSARPGSSLLHRVLHMPDVRWRSPMSWSISVTHATTSVSPRYGTGSLASFSG